MTPEETRLRNKLALWEAPGFSQFIEDLAEYLGPEISVREQVEVQRYLYKKRLEELQPPSKFKQTKLDI